MEQNLGDRVNLSVGLIDKWRSFIELFAWDLREATTRQIELNSWARFDVSLAW